MTFSRLLVQLQQLGVPPISATRADHLFRVGLSGPGSNAWHN
jgi:hypothetical protein